MHSRISIRPSDSDLSDRQIESSVNRWGINMRLHMAPGTSTSDKEDKYLDVK